MKAYGIRHNKSTDPIPTTIKTSKRSSVLFFCDPRSRITEEEALRMWKEGFESFHIVELEVSVVKKCEDRES